jgi:endonuclease YncB( thermonuclease family)
MGCAAVATAACARYLAAMRSIAVLLLALPILPCDLLAQDFSGVAYRVLDGDSLRVRTPEGREIEVRLADIDAPERGQPYADRARQALTDLVLDQSVDARFNDTDNYGRIVARIYVGAVDVSGEMLRRGLAWVYRDYVRDRSLFAIETEARAARRGLWADTVSAIAPWDWRTRARAPASPTEARDSTCGSKRYCREMRSCAEARFYMTQCGATTLDGDADGIPCEALCR